VEAAQDVIIRYGQDVASLKLKMNLFGSQQEPTLS